MIRDEDKTKKQLIAELVKTRLQVQELAQSEGWRKDRAEELGFSRQQLRLLIDTGPDYFFLKDLDLRYQLVNSALVEFFGRDEADILGRTDIDLMPVTAAAVACQESDQLAIREKRVVVTDESVGDKFYETRKFPVIIAGKMIGVAGIIRDITDRKRAEFQREAALDALRTSGKLQNTILSNVGAAIYLKDTQCRYTYVNSQVCRLFGCQAEEIIGKSGENFFTADSLEEIMKSDRRVIEHGETIMREETDLTLSDKQSRTYWVVKLPLKDASGNIYGLCGISTDITDRKQAGSQREAALGALRESEERFRILCESSRDAILMMAPDGKVSYWNQAAEQMFGYASTEALGANLHELIAPERYLEAHRVAHAEFLRSGGGAAIGKTLELQAVRKDGREITVALSLSAERIRNGWNAIGILRDITEQKEAEEELREAHRRLDEIIENLPDATFVIDAEGKVIAWNRAIEQITGVQAADMLGRDNYEYALPFYGERRPILIDLVLQSRQDIEAKYISMERNNMILDGEAYIRGLRGEELYVSCRACALHDSKGNIVGAIESIRDITDRKKAEEKYRGIFENAVMGIFQATAGRNIISANPAFARILGYESPEEIINTINNKDRPIYVNPQNHADMINYLDKYGTMKEQEVQLLRKDGSTVFVYSSGRAVRDGKGNVLYYEGTIQDITERRRLESLLRQAQKMEAIGTLAGGIAHDFNNILASMMGYTEMAAGEDHQEIRRNYLDQVMQACERAKNLVNQILSFSRMREQERKPLDIRLILKEALSLLRASLPATIEIKQQIDPEEATVLADPTQIHQIIMNLCTNAAQAMQEKGGLLTVRLSPVEFDVTGPGLHPDLHLGPYVRLSVGDTGCGIDPAIKDKIFDPFFTTKKAREGTGLGLSVVYGIVKSYGGAIDVQSPKRQGAIFTVYLPRIPTEDRMEGETPEDIDLWGDERILFVDDEEMLVGMVRTFFQSLGYSITATASSREALHLFQENPLSFDLLITDMTMPELTGAELCRQCLKIRPDLPIILCTGYSDSLNAEEIRKLRIREFCLKPVSLKDLGRLARNVLNN